MNETSPERKWGVFDFLKMIYHGHPEYSLIAVRAPIDETVQAFIEFREGQQIKERHDWKTFRTKEYKIASRSIQWEQNISIRKSKTEYGDGSEDDEGGEEIAWGIPFLQIGGSEWTVVLRSLFYLGSDELREVPQEAKALSAKLQTKAITLLEEDTSGAIAYELFENDELLEDFEEAPGSAVRFKSKLREELDLNFDWEPDDDEDYNTDTEYDVSIFPRNQFVDALYRELGIYLPACYPVTNDGKPALAVFKDSENMIERADLLVIKETLESEQKEPDPDDAE